MSKKVEISQGDFLSFGTRILDKKTIFTFTTKGREVCIVIYDRISGKIFERIDVPCTYKRGDVYSVSVSGLDWKEHCYLYEVDGKRFIDPYTTETVGRETWGKQNPIFSCVADSLLAPKPFVPAVENELIIYKVHMRGITMDKKIKESDKGNYKGLIGHIPKLKELGINAVELFPIYEFDELLSEKRVDYWGYGDAFPLYMSPKASYFGGIDAPKNALDTIEAFHRAGIAVIMEFCIPDLLNENYIIEAIRLWAYKYGVDGFRFIGEHVPKDSIYKDPFLSEKYLFFEDLPESYSPDVSDGKKRVFIENDSFIYPFRRFKNHMEGTAAELCNMLRRQGETFSYVNYVAASNGFTLYDSFTYCDKHNEDNGEENRDGNNYNFSTNSGVEGITRDKGVLKSRLSGVRVALATALLAQGIPLVNAGDEILNTAFGNNNPYCQDNPKGWINYSRKQDAKRMREYFINLVEFRKSHPILRLSKPYRLSDYRHIGTPDLSYHGKEPWNVENECRKSIGILYNGDYAEENQDIILLFNFYDREETFTLPKILGKNWYFITNTCDYEWNKEGKKLASPDCVEVPAGTLSILVAK